MRADPDSVKPFPVWPRPGSPPYHWRAGHPLQGIASELGGIAPVPVVPGPISW